MTAWRACGRVQWLRYLAEDFSTLIVRRRRFTVRRGVVRLLH